MVSRGFFGRRHSQPTRPIPPGQYLERGFPVLSAGPTPRTPLSEWTFKIEHGGETLACWTWDEMRALPQSEISVDIHCVTKWTKLDTAWKGITIDSLLEDAGVDPPEDYVLAFCDGGYTTNLPVEDLLDGKGMVALEYDGEPLEPEHGGPARLLVPHLYFCKSAKWVRGLRFIESDEPGFWETYGYHMYGDDFPRN